MNKTLFKLFSMAVILAFVFSFLPASSHTVKALSPNIVISQIYGGGGNTGSTYTHDFIELFNRGTAPVSIAGWSLQYASATGTGLFGSSTTMLTELPDIVIAPGHYYLVQEAKGTYGTTPLPTPDLIDPTPIAMAATGGKVALVSIATTLGCNGGSTPCTVAQLALIVDLVGWDGANFYETAPAPATTNTTALLRNNGGCDETDNNSADFAVGAPTPRNSSSPTNSCVVEPKQPKINEFSASTTGTDVEYIEIYGGPNTDYSAYTVLEIEGDGTGAGVVDEVISVGTTNAEGFWLINLAPDKLENGTITLLLVKDFTGALGQDLDTNNDGVFDLSKWSEVTDSIAIWDGGVDDRTYLAPILKAYYDGLAYTPGGASRYPDGTDTEATADWVRNDFDLAGIEGFTGTIVLGEAYNTPGKPNAIYVPPPEACGDPFTKIGVVQGSGLASPLVGTEVAVEGVVVGDFQNNTSLDDGNLNGFHIQDPTGDGNPLTSDGVFIYTGSVDVNIGETVRVRGAVSEYNGMTEITASKIWVCDVEKITLTPTPLALPVTAVEDFEPYEGMLVTFPQALVISEYFNFDRYGEIVLTSERHFTPTAIYEPGSPEYYEAAAAFLLDKITLDDGRTVQNPDPAIHPNGDVFDLDNLFRGGDLVTDVTGVIDYSFSLYRIQPTQGADYTPVNPRPAAPPEVGGTLKIAAMNTLNYFLTIDTGALICGPLQNMECRGADTDEELVRQRAKLLAALSGLDAAVIGLNELENTTGVEPLADIVAGLADLGLEYAYIETGTIGTDAIKVGLIYKPALVTPVGEFKILDSTVDPRFLDTKNRPSLAQTFEENSTGARFTVAVNHLKSKGSACVDVGDPDLLDGAGNCNLTRTYAAQALVDWLATDPTGSGDPDFIILGDLNSYTMEDPIDAIKTGPDDQPGTGDDYTNLIFDYMGLEAYSYVFDGQIGYLDHALANKGMAAQVTGVSDWHINADEPDLIDYDMTFKLPAQDALYAPDQYRTSDHDAVIVGLNLTTQFTQQSVIGGGWINSLEGFYKPDLTITGKANFGFVLKYLQADMVPTGNLEFQLAEAGMNFKSTSFTWLQVFTPYALFMGHGTINGEGDYRYLVEVKDSKPDMFHIKIWDAADPTKVIYETSSLQKLGGGSIQILK